MSADDGKIAAARAALDFVEPGMRLGIGTGSTAAHFVRLLGEKVRAGLVVAGAYPAGAHDLLWDDDHLRGVAARFWETEKPLALFGNAVLLFSRLRYSKTGSPLLHARRVTALPRAAERATALLYAACSSRFAELCSRRAPRRAAAPQQQQQQQAGDGGGAFAYAPLGVEAAAAGGGGAAATKRAAAFACVEDEVAAALRMSSLFVAAPPVASCATLRALVIENDFSPVRPADPYHPEAAVVVEDAALFTAQGGGDAFVLARRLLDKLEVVPRAF